MEEFAARIQHQGILRCVDVPGRVTEVLGPGHVAVRGDIDGRPFQSTLTPRGEGLQRLFVHSSIYTALGVGAGDLVRVRLEVDPDPVPGLPDELAEALDEAGRRDLFDELTPARRREIIRYVEAAKGEATRAARVEAIVERLATDLRPRRPPLLD